MGLTPNTVSVDATRAAPAQGTGRRGGASTNGDDDTIRVDDDPLNRETGGEQGQQRIGHGEEGTLGEKAFLLI